MNPHVMHNLIHADYGGNSQRCPICNGSMKMTDTKKLEEMCSDILARKQTYMYGENRKSLTSGIHKTTTTDSKLTLKTSFEFAEKVEEMPKEIMLVPIGAWDTTKYGRVEVTKADVEMMKRNFDANVRKGVMIDIEHRQNTTYGEQAGGWIKAVEVRATGEDKGLWATEIEWTSIGEELVKGKIYKFLSPEFDVVHVDPENENRVLENVLIATTLCNRPLLKEIPALTFSEGKNLTANPNGVILFIEPDNSTQQGPTNMPTFEDALKKLMAGETITADEKSLLEQNKEKMNDEQQIKAGFKVEAKETKPSDGGIGGKQDEVTTISATELAELRKSAQEGRTAFAKIEADEVTKTFESFQFSEKGGKLSPDNVKTFASFALKLSPALRQEFTELVKALPEKQLFGEVGTSDSSTINQSRDAVRAEVAAYAKENKLSFGEALRVMQSKDPGKFASYTKSFTEEQ